MPKDNENFRLPSVGPIDPSEPPGFTLAQMIRCEECLRSNPPTRVNCLYCNVLLPVTASSARLRKPILRPLEKHETGYNVIVLPAHEARPAKAVGEAAALLKLKAEDLERIITQDQPLPLARTGSFEEAELIVDRLEEFGFRLVTLRDEGVVKRVRSLSFTEPSLVINAGRSVDEVTVSWPNVLLLVPARLVEKRVEVTEAKGRGAENELLDTSELFSDEAVIDLYLSTHAETWRISAHGFDFSCLESEKTLLANENIARLQHRLLAQATSARLNDSYNRMRPVLDLVWTPEQETRSSGWRRERPGKLSVGMATISTNESQFTRYSRLLRYFLQNNS